MDCQAKDEPNECELKDSQEPDIRMLKSSRKISI